MIGTKIMKSRFQKQRIPTGILGPLLFLVITGIVFCSVYNYLPNNIILLNRAAEQDGASSASGDASPSADGKDWERIANLCDFNPKSSKQQKDISRMRSLILQLKQNPPISRRQSSAGSSNAS